MLLELLVIILPQMSLKSVAHNFIIYRLYQQNSMEKANKKVIVLGSTGMLVMRLSSDKRTNPIFLI